MERRMRIVLTGFRIGFLRAPPEAPLSTQDHPAMTTQGHPRSTQETPRATSPKDLLATKALQNAVLLNKGNAE